MNKITRDEFLDVFLDYLNTFDATERSTIRNRLWSRIQEVQPSEPMSLGEIERHVCEVLLVGQENLWEAIQPLTVKQGFVPDWSKAPTRNKKLPDKAAVFWYWDDGGIASGTAIHHWHRPAPKMRPKTGFEKISAWTEWKKAQRKANHFTDSPYYASQLLAEELVEGKSIDDLCRAAGIPLEVEA